LGPKVLQDMGLLAKGFCWLGISGDNGFLTVAGFKRFISSKGCKGQFGFWGSKGGFGGAF